MRHWAWSVVVVVACALAAACQPRAALSDRDKAAIRTAHHEFDRMISAGPSDLPGLVKMYYTETARVLPPNAPMADGREAILRAFMAMGRVTAFKSGPLTIDGRGGTAMVEATYQATIEPPGGGEPIADKGKYIEIWQRQPDGSWKASRDIWNSDLPLTGLVVPSGTLAANAGPELRELDWLVGRWAIEGQSRTASALGPAGVSMLAMNCRWLVGGTNLFCTVDGMLPGGPYHDVMVHTYDTATRTFRGFDADSTGMTVPFGLVIGKGSWVYTYDLRIGGKPVRMRMTLFDLSQNGCSYSQAVSTSGGPFVVVSEGTGRRLPE